MSLFSIEKMRRRALLFAAGAAVLVVVAIALTGSMWAAVLPPASLLQKELGGGSNQAPAAVENGAAATQNVDQSTSGKAWLGIMIADADGGVKVLQVLPNGPAAKADVKKDDVITAVNNINVANAKDLVNEVQKNKTGDKIVLSLKRGSDQKQIDVTAGSVPSHQGGNQPFASGNLPPELKGLEGIPLREMFGHFVGGTFRMKDKDGKELVINVTPGTVTNATSTSLSINPTDGGATRQFDVSKDTKLIGAGLQGKIENLKADTTVLVITVGNSSHASAVVRESSAYNPLENVMPNLRAPRLWQMPDTQPFRNWNQQPPKPNAQPSM